MVNNFLLSYPLWGRIVAMFLRCRLPISILPWVFGMADLCKNGISKQRIFSPSQDWVETRAVIYSTLGWIYCVVLCRLLFGSLYSQSCTVGFLWRSCSTTFNLSNFKKLLYSFPVLKILEFFEYFEASKLLMAVVMK